MKTQVLIIHGGHALDTGEDFLQYLQEYTMTIRNLKPEAKWSDNLQKDLGHAFEVFRPKMPNKENARYEEWKIWFEKFVPFLHDGLICVGHSLGGIFLIKYLSENPAPRKIKSLFMVAAPFLGKNGKHGRNNNFTLGKELENIYEKAENIIFFHSKDDPIVPLKDFEMYMEKLPKATFRLLEGRGHFNEPTFPELVSDITSHNIS